MGSWAKGRLAFIIAAMFAVAAFFTQPVNACTSRWGCPADPNAPIETATADTTSKPERAAEPVGQPIKLKKFTRSHTRAARRAHRNAALAQRAHASKHAHKVKPVESKPAESRS